MLALWEQLLPVIVPVLTSALMWLVRRVVPTIMGMPNVAQRLVLGAVGVLVAAGAALVGQTVGADPMAWNEATAQGLVAAVVAHFIYRIGKKS